MKGIRKILILTLVLTVAVSGMPMSVFAVSDEPEETKIPHYAEGEAIVSYVEKKNLSTNTKRVLQSQSVSKAKSLLDGAETLMKLDDEPVEDVNVKRGVLSLQSVEEEKVDKVLAVVKSDELTTEELIAELEKLPNVDYAEPNYCRDLFSGDATSEQWAYNGSSDYGLHIDNWNDGSNVNAKDTVVAVLDTGVDYNHEDLKNVMWAGGNDIQALKDLGGGKYGIFTACDKDGGYSTNPADDNGHGTHCAGIIGAQWNGFGVSGAANGVKIMAVNAYSKDGFYEDDLIEGMNYIKTAKQNGVNVVAVNNSYGNSIPYGSSEAKGVCDAVKGLGSEDVVCVFAAGNVGKNCDKYYSDYDDPATREVEHYKGYFDPYYYQGLENVIVVGASDSSGSRAYFSNYGKTTVDVFAPGVNIASTCILSSGGRYVYMDGTSQACPAVTGEVAILRAQAPSSYKATDIIALVKNNVTAGSSTIQASCTSGGYANVSKALAAIRNDINCEVEYYREGLTDGEYVLEDVENLIIASTGDYIATPKAYEGYTYNPNVAETVDRGKIEDGKILTLKLYYDISGRDSVYSVFGGAGGIANMVCDGTCEARASFKIDLNKVDWSYLSSAA